jgi:hypothetical protein
VRSGDTQRGVTGESTYFVSPNVLEERGLFSGGKDHSGYFFKSCSTTGQNENISLQLSQRYLQVDEVPQWLKPLSASALPQA